MVDRSAVTQTYSTITPEQREEVNSYLSKHDLVFIVDDSKSMAINGLWSHVGSALLLLSEVALSCEKAHITIHFLNHDMVSFNIKSSERVQDIYTGVTPTSSSHIAWKLEKLSNEYLAAIRRFSDGKLHSDVSVKPVRYVVVTDGEPSDLPQLKRLLQSLSKQLDDEEYPADQLLIHFVQIGKSSSPPGPLADSIMSLHHAPSNGQQEPNSPRRIAGVTLTTGKMLTVDEAVRCLIS